MIGKDATKKHFLESAPLYNILHLATHAVSNSSTNEQAKLFFYPCSSKIEENVLRADELPSINLNAQMIVLSACNSGNGKIINGTGTLSLAYAFSVAGCPNVIMSRWTSDDNSNSIIMNYFYRELKKGQSKSEALRNAKLLYLKSADPLFTHPFYWAGINSFGDDSPIEKKSKAKTNLLYLYAYISIALIFAFILSKLIPRN